MKKMKVLLLIVFVLTFSNVFAQENPDWSGERPRPAAWKNLVFGGRFMDRFLPMPTLSPLTRNTWGAPNVLPRDINNGIENGKFSFWCGSIIRGEDQKYHMYVVGWPESSPKGHQNWFNSVLYNAVSDNSFGPFVVQDTIGKGHNAEVFKSKDGHYVVYVIDGRYTSTSCNGPWQYSHFDFQNRDRKIIEGLSNMTFTKREDGSFLAVCRGGGIWISNDGLSSYNQVTETRAYPDIKGNFEDPVIWRDHVQYHLIVNDWYGRIAYYLRSKDGINWRQESGEAYMPGIARHDDGTVENWFKYERMRVFQDEYGRATQAGFAVIDVEKYFDKGNDIHSSKHIIIPLAVGRLMNILDKRKISPESKTVRVQLVAEKGFNPHTDVDISSLQFGEPELVNYGKGGKVIKTEKKGKDLIVTFDASACVFPEEEFAAKMIGRTTDGKLLYGYARLPLVKFIEPILSPRFPEFICTGNDYKLAVEVQNFGQVASSGKSTLTISYIQDNKEIEFASALFASLKPFQKTQIELHCGNIFEKCKEYKVVVRVNSGNKKSEILHGKVVSFK